jgi:hypothetical protein
MPILLPVLLDRGRGTHHGGDVYHGRAGRGIGHPPTVGFDLQRFPGLGAGRSAGQGASASARVWDVSEDFAEVRAGRETVDAGGCHPQVHFASGAAHASRRSRRAEGWHVGRRGRVRPGDGRDRATFDRYCGYAYFSPRESMSEALEKAGEKSPEGRHR